jgi:HK97 family phage major capsid protein
MARADEAAPDDEEGKKEKEDDRDDEGEGDDERSRWQHHPAVVRSRGRKSAETIGAHSRKYDYSVARAAGAVYDQRSLTGIEREVNDELRRSNPFARGNFLAPCGDWERLNQRALTTSTGAGSIPQYWDGFIDYLYPKMVGPQLGFTYMGGLTAQTNLPRLSGPPSVAAVAESSAAGASNPTLDDVSLSPHGLSGNVTISRLFALQSTVAADRVVIDSLSAQIARKMDQWALTGGSANEPVGLLNNTAVTQTQVATSNAPSYSDLVAMRTKVHRANALDGRLGFCTSPGGLAKLGTITKIASSTFPIYLANDDNEALGYPIVASAQVSESLSYCGTNNLTPLIFGAWQYLIVATFGNALDIIVDPLTGSTAGNLTITAFTYTDTNVQHPNAFVVMPNVAP